MKENMLGTSWYEYLTTCEVTEAIAQALAIMGEAHAVSGRYCKQ